MRKYIIFVALFRHVFFQNRVKNSDQNQKKTTQKRHKNNIFFTFLACAKLPCAKPNLPNAKTKFTQPKNKIYHTQKKIYHTQKKSTIRKKNLPYAKKNLPYAKKTSIRITPPTAHTSTLFYLQVENCNASRLRLHFRRLIIGIRCLSRRSFFQSSTSFTGVNGL